MQQVARDIKDSLDRIETRFDRLDDRLEKQSGRLDDRLTKNDERHHRDFRVLCSAIIGGALGLASLMAKGFHWL